MKGVGKMTGEEEEEEGKVGCNSNREEEGIWLNWEKNLGLAHLSH